MRVLSINHLLDPVSGGGTAERTFQLCRALAHAGLECAVLTLDIGLASRRADLHGVRLTAVRCLSRRFFVPWGAWPVLRREVARVDIVHMMGHWTLLNALAYLATRAAGRPYVVTPAGALPITGRSGFLKWLYNRVIGFRLIRAAAGHIAITPDETGHFSRYGVAPDSVAVIPNGVSPALPAVDCTDFLARHGLARRRFVLFLGRLAYIKGPDLLLEAFARLAAGTPSLDLVYAGPDGGMLVALRDQAARLGLSERVHFTGYLGGQDKACALRSCDLLAIPSRREAMSIVALEAGAYARPALLTDQCGFEAVERMGGGRLAGATAASLGGVLEQMIRDPEELTRMGARLKVFVESQFTWERAAAQHIALFRRITDA